MMSVKNVKSLVAKLKAKANKIAPQQKVSVIVGFTAAYAIYVHENLEAYHPVGQAKFLADAAINNEKQVCELIGNAIDKGKTLAQALLLGGLKLQAEAQKLCPVDTGALKGSAFTKLSTDAGNPGGE